MTEQTASAGVRRDVTVAVGVERAFDVFTRQIGSWWPRESHHIGPMPARAVMEDFQGGRCYSVSDDGTETDWGRVLAWEPPGRVVFAWLLTPQWEYEPDPARASEVAVVFTPLDDGRTHVELTHSGFERYAQGGDEMRAQVGEPGGWGALIDLYANSVA